MFERFADGALYSIHITDPATGVTRDRYDFRFSSITGGLKNPNTILSYGLGTEAGPIVTIGDARQNFTQTYSVTTNNSALGSGNPVPPPNVGLRTTPAYNDSTTGKAISGATTLAGLDSLTRQGIRALPGGVAVWAGSREDGFYADTSAIFDLLDPRVIADRDGNPDTGGLGQDGGGTDSFKGYNVLSYGIQIPVTSLTNGSYTDPIIGSSATGVGVYASVSRQRITLRVSDGDSVNSGVDAPGIYVIAYRSTHNVIELEATRFEAYLREEHLEQVSRRRAERGQSGAPGREAFSRCAKAIIVAGETDATGYDRVLGLTLELVPERNPATLQPGDELPVRLLYEGSPLPNAYVSAVNAEDATTRIEARTDAQGQARLRLGRGGVWLVRCVHMFPLLTGSERTGRACGPP